MSGGVRYRYKTQRKNCMMLDVLAPPGSSREDISRQKRASDTHSDQAGVARSIHRATGRDRENREGTSD